MHNSGIMMYPGIPHVFEPNHGENVDFFGKVPSSLSKMRFNLEFSCYKTTNL